MAASRPLLVSRNRHQPRALPPQPFFSQPNQPTHHPPSTSTIHQPPSKSADRIPDLAINLARHFSPTHTNTQRRKTLLLAPCSLLADAIAITCWTSRSLCFSSSLPDITLVPATPRQHTRPTGVALRTKPLHPPRTTTSCRVENLQPEHSTLSYLCNRQNLAHPRRFHAWGRCWCMRGTVNVDNNDCAQLTSRPTSGVYSETPCSLLDLNNKSHTRHQTHKLPWSLYD